MSASRGKIAAQVAEAKRLSPEKFCPRPKCLWRVKHIHGPDTPCRKHPVVKPETSEAAS